METKRNLKYFTSKGINVIFIVGAVICLLGVALLFEKNTRNFGMVIILVGLIVAVFGSGAKSGESDIDNQIYSVTKDMPEQAQVKYEVYEKHFLKIINPVFLKGFDFTEKDLICKKGHDHKFRTGSYNAAQLYFTREKIYIYGKHLDLINEAEDASYEFGGVYTYGEVDKAYIEEEKMRVLGREINVHYFVLKLKNGEEAIRMTVEYGADTDKAADDINHATEKMTERAEERAADKEAKRAALRALDAEKKAKAEA